MEAQALQKVVARLERTMDEAYSRHAAAGNDTELLTTLASALDGAVRSTPEAYRRLALELLEDRFGDSGGDGPADAEAAAEIAILRAEVDRLKVELMKKEESISGGAIVDALIGPEEKSTLAADGRLDPARVATVVSLLCGFSTDLARAFLGTDATAADNVTRFRNRLCAELKAEGSDQLGPLLLEIKENIGTELAAFHRACEEGGLELLKQLDPLLFEHKAEKDGQKVLGLRPFRFREMWEAFGRRYNELVNGGGLYEGYFNGPLKRARFKLRRAKRK